MTSGKDALAVVNSVTGRTQTAEAIDANRVCAFLRRQPDLGGRLVEVTLDHTRRKSGASSGTQIIDVELENAEGERVRRRLVFRYDLGGTFFFQYNLVDQFRIMKAVHAAGFPCPNALWLDEAGEIAGAPGLFMVFVAAPAPSGQPFAEGPIVDATPHQRHEMILASARTIARLHRLPLASLDLTFLEHRGIGSHFIDREIDWTARELLRAIPDGFGGVRRSYYAEAKSALLKVRDHLLTRAPRSRAPELVHGDPNLSNFMYRGTEVEVLLDWELCHIGLGEADLAYCIAGCDHFLYLLPPIEGVPSTEEIVHSYAAARGKLEDWDFCQAMGEWRLAVYQAMAFSRLPPKMEHVEEAYWAQTKPRLAQFVPL